jgi:hypothetical protein
MIESIRCPNCGSIAERHHLSYLAQVKTQCDACDYLLVMCTRSGHVLESYAPGLPSEPRPMQPIAVRLTPLAQPQSNNSRRDVAALSA